MTKKKCIVMFSGGLDSRLAIKIMQEQGFEVLALYFDLPFGTGCCSSGCSFNFSQLHGIKLHVVDCKKEPLLQEYLKVQKEALHGRGAGVNACIDCRIFIFKKTKEIADKMGVDLIVSGEVLGERPMSQMKKSMSIVEEKSGLKGRLLRPLSAKLLPKTNAEKEGIIDVNKLYAIKGRRRVPQMELAKQFEIDYPSPAGGCSLCEKALIKRYNFLFDRGVKESELPLVNIGRHFDIGGCWVVIGKNKLENDIIEKFEEGELVEPSFSGPSARIMGKMGSVDRKIVDDIILAYSKKGSLEEREKFESFKL